MQVRIDRICPCLWLGSLAATGARSRGGADSHLRTEFRDFASDISGPRRRFRPGFGHDRHDLRAGLKRPAGSH
jgi:hypothetical protein